MISTEKIIFDYLDSISKDIIQRANSNDQNLSNKIPKSFKVDTSFDEKLTCGKLSAWQWTIAAWETGRGKTKNRSGDGSLRKGIRRWLDKRNIKPRGKYKDLSKALDSLAYVISQKIHREGTALWNSRDDRFSGNRSMTISDFINEKSVKSFSEKFAKAFVSANITPLLNFRDAK